MTDEQILDIRTLCRFCNTRWRYLGSHIGQAHGITAREYKKEIGVQLKIPLTEPSLEELQRRRNQQTSDSVALTKRGEATRYIPGESRHQYVSQQFREVLVARNSEPIQQTCGTCGSAFVGVPGRICCLACKAAKEPLRRARRAEMARRRYAAKAAVRA